MEIILNEQQKKDVVTTLANHGFSTSDIEIVLDNIFNEYLWSQYDKVGDSFLEAYNFHTTIVEVKKILRAIATSVKEASYKK